MWFDIRCTSGWWCTSARAALLLWMLTSARMGLAQSSLQPTPAADNSTTAESSSLLIPEQPTTIIPALPQMLESAEMPVPTAGYWIIDTHQSPQSFDRTGPRFCPGTVRYDPCCGYRRSEFSEFCQSLQPGIPVCICVHGSLVSWEDVCRESKCTWQWLQQGRPDLPLQVVFFTWPSDRPIGPLVGIDFCLLGQRAARNGFYLADLIRHLPPECPVSLVGHSHGTRVISSALHLMGGGAVEGLVSPRVTGSGRQIRAVFAASALDHDWLNPDERYGRALCSAQCILNLKNSLDPALHVYPLRRPFSSRALGNVGFTSKDRWKMGGFSSRVRDLDVSPQIGHGHFWPNYFNKPWLSRSISNYVFFPEQIENTTVEPSVSLRPPTASGSRNPIRPVARQSAASGAGLVAAHR